MLYTFAIVVYALVGARVAPEKADTRTALLRPFNYEQQRARVVMQEKTCITCGKSQSITEFYKNRGGKYGVHSKCKSCSKAYRESRRDVLIPYFRDYNNRRRKNDLKMVIERTEEAVHQRRIVLHQNYRARNKEKCRARWLVKSAITAGKMIRPEKCAKCNRKKKIIQGHHEDPSKPLEVVWLCRKCHFARHDELKVENPEKWSWDTRLGGGKK